MGTRAMKQDLFAIKAVQSKGYDIHELIKLNDNDLDNLQLSSKLKEFIKDYKLRGGKTSTEIAEEIANIMVQETAVLEVDKTLNNAVHEYKTNTDEQQLIVDEIQSSVVIPDGEIEIVRSSNAKDDIDTIVLALSEKEYKSFAPLLKHLKNAVPAQILSSVDGAKVNELIEARIAEVKAKSESTK